MSNRRKLPSSDSQQSLDQLAQQPKSKYVVHSSKDKTRDESKSVLNDNSESRIGYSKTRGNLAASVPEYTCSLCEMVMHSSSDFSAHSLTAHFGHSQTELQVYLYYSVYFTAVRFFVSFSN